MGMNMPVPVASTYPMSTFKRTSRGIDARLRHLDVDDLYLLRLLGHGKRLSDCARALSLTQPAITQRIHKIESALGFNVLERNMRGTHLTEHALNICIGASDAIDNLETVFSTGTKRSDCISVTSPWAAWLAEEFLAKVSNEVSAIDIEFVSAHELTRGNEVSCYLRSVLHRRTSGPVLPGFRSLGSTSRQAALWAAPGFDFSKESNTKVFPLVEVSRDDALLDSAHVQQIQSSTPGIRGICYAGTVAGAMKQVARGHGILVAPEGDVGPELVKILPATPLPQISFDLLVHERAPVMDLVSTVMAVLK